MKLKELLDRVEVLEASADLEMEITGVCYDSRTAEAGSLFVAIRGLEDDGHKYISAALERGARCVIAEEAPAADVPYILVKSGRRALAAAAASFYGHPAERLKVIGVTGTNGKTTVTHLMKTVLETITGEKVGLIGTNSILIGEEALPTERTTPESCDIQRIFREMLDAGCAYAVMEVSSHALALDRVYGIEFELGIFTNLTPDHLDFHKDMDDYCAAKARLFTMCRNGAVNIDDEYGIEMLRGATCPVVTYSANNAEADIAAKRIRLLPDRVAFTALMIGQLQEVELGIPGMISVYNALSVLAGAVSMGMETSAVADALRRGHGVKGRVEVVPTDRPFTVIIDYAHTPDALKNIIATVRGFAKGRVVTLFGCGGDRDRAKRPLMGAVAAESSDFVVVTSDNPRTEEPGAIIRDILKGMDGTETPYTVIESRREAIAWVLDNAQPEDTLILAGKGHETYQVFGKEKIHFDEREVIAEHLAARAGAEEA